MPKDSKIVKTYKYIVNNVYILTFGIVPHNVALVLIPQPTNITEKSPSTAPESVSVLTSLCDFNKYE